MARRKITAGITGVAVPIRVYDTSSTTGAGLGSLVYNTSGLVAEYRRQGQATWTSITLSAGTLGTWSSGGFIADGSLTGSYEVGIPDAAFTSGRWTLVRLYGATNMDPVLLEFELDAVNYQDGVRLGLTALPNAAAAASGGLPTVGATIPNATAGAAGGLFVAGTNAATTVTGSLTTTFTGNLTGSVGSVTGNVGGNVTGSVGSVAGNVGGNVTGNVAGTVTLAAAQSFNNTGQTANLPANTKQFLGQAVVLDANNLPGVNLVDYAGSAVTASDGTAQAGSTTQITLAAGASAVTDFYKGYRVTAVGGAGINQVAYISAYNGSTKVANLDRTLPTAFDSTTTYILDAPAAANVVQWLGSTPSALTSGLVQASASLALGTDSISAAAMSAGAVSKIQAGLATPTNITAGTITTVTNLTNAPTSGDFTATMKTSLSTATVGNVTLAASQPNYAPAKAGDAMTLTSAYDPAKTAAQAATALSTATWTGTRAGYLDNLSAGAVAPAATALSTAVWTNTKAGYLDLAISQSGGTTPPTAAAIRQEMDANSIKLANLDTNVGSRATAAQAAAAILVTPSQKLLTDANGYVTTSNPASSGSGVTEATIWAYATRTLSDRTGFTLTSAYDPAKTAAQASQIPSGFTSATFASPGVFATAALANAPTGGGGGGSVTVAGYAAGQDPATLVWAAGSRSLTDKANFALAVTPPTAAAITTAVVAGMAGAPVGSVATPVTLTSAYDPAKTAQVGSPSGVVVAGSTGSSVIVSGLPSGRSYVGQHLYHSASGEARTIAGQTSSGGNYTFTFTGASGTEAGPFSAVTAADAVCPVP